MSKTKILIRIHSFIQTTTNSSSETFVCVPEKIDQDLRKDFLKQMEGYEGYIQSFDVITTPESLKEYLDDDDFWMFGSEVFDEILKLTGIPKESFEVGGEFEELCDEMKMRSRISRELPGPMWGPRVNLEFENQRRALGEKALEYIGSLNVKPVIILDTEYLPEEIQDWIYDCMNGVLVNY